MKILVVGDLHGQVPRIREKDFDLVIAPGDFCSSKLRNPFFLWMNAKKKNPSLKKKWYDFIGRRKTKKLLDEAVSDGREVLEFLNSLGKPVLIIPGNWDYQGFKDSDWKPLRKNYYAQIKNGLKNIIDLNDKKKTLMGVDFVGYGGSLGPEYPVSERNKSLYTKDELKRIKKDYNKKLKKIDILFSDAKQPIIFVGHNVPYGTNIDKVKNKDSPAYGEHMGSIVATEIIKRHQPLLFIGGHIHEYHDEDKIGNTLCVNTGHGKYVNTIIYIKNGKITKTKFIGRNNPR